MTNYTYNQTIEYVDGTRDLNFEASRKWAHEHGTTFEEDMSARTKADGVLKRFFTIGDEPKPYTPPELSDEEKQERVRFVRNRFLEETDKYMLVDYPITDEEREQYKAYRVYLRDYTLEDEWWLANPKTFEEWKQPSEELE